MATTVINGVTFDVIKCRDGRKYERLFNEAFECGGLGLFDYYDNPSEAKRDIYKDIRNWAFSASDIDITHFGVCSANCQVFSISAILYSKAISGVIRITKDHNRIYTM